MEKFMLALQSSEFREVHRSDTVGEDIPYWLYKRIFHMNAGLSQVPTVTLGVKVKLKEKEV